MPVFFNTALDDELIFDVCPNFAGGQVSNARANILEENQAAQLINCDVTRVGEIITRRGHVKFDATRSFDPGPVVQGLHVYEHTSGSITVMLFANHLLYKWDGLTWISQGSATPTSTTTRFSVTQGVNTLFFADRVGGTLKYWFGTNIFDLGGTTNSDPPNAPRNLAWHTHRLVIGGTDLSPEALYFSQFLDANVWDRSLWSFLVGATGDRIQGILSWSDFNLIVFKRRSIWIVHCDPAIAVAEFPIRPVHQRIGCPAPLTATQVGSDVWFLADDGVRSVKRTLAVENQEEASETLSIPVQDIINRINSAAIDRACATFWNNRYILAVPVDDSLLNNYMLVYNFLTDSWHGSWIMGSTIDNYNLSPAVFARHPHVGSSHLMIGVNLGIGTSWPSTDVATLEWQDHVFVADETDAVFRDITTYPIPVTILTRAVTFREAVNPKTGVHVELEFGKSAIGAIATVTAIKGDGTSTVLGTVDTSTGLVTPTGQPAYTLPSGTMLRPAFDLMALGPFRELQIKVTTDPASLPSDPKYSKLILRSIILSGFVDTIRLQTAA